MKENCTKKYKTRHDIMGKAIHREVCKKLSFAHTTEWYMYKLDSILENDTPNSLGFLDTNRSPNACWKTSRVIITKKKERERELWNCGLCHHSGSQNENQRKWKEREVLEPCQSTKDVTEHDCNSDTIYNWFLNAW